MASTRMMRPLSALLAVGMWLCASSAKSINAPDEDTQRAIALYQKGDFAGAADIMEKRAQKVTAAFGPESAQAIMAWEGAAEVLKSAERCPRAIEVATAVLREKEKILGPTERGLLTPLSILAGCYLRIGRLAEAQRFLEKGAAVVDANFHKPHPERVAFGNLVGLLKMDTGDYEGAAQVYREVIAEAQMLPEEERGGMVTMLSNVSIACSKAGDFGCARSSAEDAVREAIRLYGPNHPAVATAIHNEASVLLAMKDYARAAARLNAAIAISEKIAGPNSLAVADHLRELGYAQSMMGANRAAQTSLERALQILEQLDAEAPAETALVLESLGLLADREKRYPESLAYHERSLKIRRSTFGAEHPDTNSSIANVALALTRRGRFEEALPYLEQALALDVKQLGDAHLKTAISYNNLAGAEFAMGRMEEAFATLSKGLAVENRVIPQLFAVGVQDQRAHFKQLTEGALHGALSIAARHLSDRENVVRRAYEFLVCRKGWALDAFASLERSWSSSEQPPIRQQWRKLQEARAALARERLAKSASAPQGQASPVEASLARVDEHERMLLRAAPPNPTDLIPPRIDPSVLAGRLPRQGVLLDFAKISDRSIGTVIVEWRYIVFVLTSEGGVSVRDLGPSAAIDEYVKALYLGLGVSGRWVARGIDDLGETPSSDANTGDALIDAALERLWMLLLEPLQTLIADRRWLVIAPDDEINFVPFAALKDPRGRYLIEEGKTLSYVSSARDLMRSIERTASGAEAVVVADPDYGSSPQGSDSAGAQATAASLLRFEPLPGTAAEARIVAHFVPGTRTLSKRAASEPILARMESPRILHFATHGFFGLTPTAQAADDFEAMSLSGLALAGASHCLSASDSQDGILTAWELLGLNLSATDLLVFSSCDSATGRISRGEGLVGLRRAAAVAGVRRALAALWEVEDERTVRFMEDFYRAYVAEQPPAVAVGDAQRALIDRLREGRPDAPASPRIWAPFVVQEQGGWASAAQN